MNNKVNRVAIVGTGFVGTAIAYSIVNQGITEELVLIDVNQAKAEGEAMDLVHGVPFAPSRTKIWSGGYDECKDTDVVIITAGVNQKPGETRLALVERNASIMKSIIKEIVSAGFKGILVIASNPVDILTYIAWKESGFEKGRVIGSGTTLDTARLRHELSAYLGIDPRNIHTYIMGEHGDTEFATWSHTFIGSQPLESYMKKHSDKYKKEDLEQIFINVRDAAYYIIERKQATYFGIGMCVARITKAILTDEKAILPVSVYLDGQYRQQDIYSSAPAVVGREGVSSIIELDLTEEELQKLDHSMSVLKETMKPVL